MQGQALQNYYNGFTAINRASAAGKAVKAALDNGLDYNPAEWAADPSGYQPTYLGDDPKWVSIASTNRWNSPTAVTAGIPGAYGTPLAGSGGVPNNQGGPVMTAEAPVGSASYAGPSTSSPVSLGAAPSGGAPSGISPGGLSLPGVNPPGVSGPSNAALNSSAYGGATTGAMIGSSSNRSTVEGARPWYDEAASDLARGYGDLTGYLSGQWGDVSGAVREGQTELARAALESTANFGQTAASDIAQKYAKQRARNEQDLQRRGLGNTTIKGSLEKGLTASQAREMTALDEAVNQQRLQALNTFGSPIYSTQAQLGSQAIGQAGSVGQNALAARQALYGELGTMLPRSADATQQQQTAGSSASQQAGWQTNPLGERQLTQQQQQFQSSLDQQRALQQAQLDQQRALEQQRLNQQQQQYNQTLALQRQNAARGTGGTSYAPSSTSAFPGGGTSPGGPIPSGIYGSNPAGGTGVGSYGGGLAGTGGVGTSGNYPLTTLNPSVFNVPTSYPEYGSSGGSFGEEPADFTYGGVDFSGLNYGNG